MIAWKSTLLSISIFCIAFLSKWSLGISGCSIDDVFKQIKSVLDSVKSPVADLSYNETLALTKNLTSYYFTSTCQTPSFCYAFKDFSNCELNKNVYQKVEADIQVVMADVDSALGNSDDLTFDQLIEFGDRIESIAKNSFQISYRYASSHTLLCTNLLLLRNLATQFPGSNSTASERLTESLNACTNRFNDNEFEMVDTLYAVTTKNTWPFFSGTYTITIEYSYEDTFSFTCGKKNTPTPQCPCTKADQNRKQIPINTVEATYGKVFNPGYCELREKLSIFTTTSAVVGVQCHDNALYIGQSFSSGDWYVRNKPSGMLYGVYSEGTRVAIGIPLSSKKDSYYIDVEHKRVGRNGDVICKNVTLLTRCDTKIPKVRSACLDDRVPWDYINNL